METLYVEKAAELAKCNVHTIRRAIDSGALRAYKPGKRIIISQADLIAWIESTVIIPRKDVRLRNGAHPDIIPLLKRKVLR